VQPYEDGEKRRQHLVQKAAAEDGAGTATLSPFWAQGTGVREGGWFLSLTHFHKTPAPSQQA